MPRAARRTLLFLVDVAVLSGAFWLAFLLRFDGDLPRQMWKRLLFTWPYVVALQYIVLYSFAVPSVAWRYMSLRDTTSVGKAIALSAAILLAARVAAAVVDDRWGYAIYALVPAGVVLVDAALAFVGIVGVRALRRLSGERHDARVRQAEAQQTDSEPVLLIGAGEAGATVAKDLALRPNLRLRAVGFLDDDPSKRGLLVQGVPVLGATDRLAEFAARVQAQTAIITIASASSQQVRRIVHLCDAAGLRAKIVPGVHEIIDGQLNLSRIRDVSIEDLLGRKPVELEVDLVSGFVSGKRVLVTGAGGSIGSELCRQLARFRPAVLGLVEQAEFSLFNIHQELLADFPDLRFHPIICDVCDGPRVEAVFAEVVPDVVFHAAAHKHVPMMEWNPGEAIKNNVFGTKTVADAAAKHNAGAFVMISTDKAVNPTSIMGASKRAAELYIQAQSQRSRTKFVAVRFGNVLGSAGSVVPTFKAQIAAGGPVTVTHPDMKRYFMTIPEASQLVMQAAAMGRGGEIFVLDMGEPVRIADLAEELIRLSGLKPGIDVNVVYTGIRPGEKLFEELGFDAERMNKTRHDKIWVGRLGAVDPEAVAAGYERLRTVTGCSSASVVRAALRAIVPELEEPEAHGERIPIAPPSWTRAAEEAHGPN